MSTTDDSVHAYLVSRGCAPHIVRRGLEGLLHQWSATVRGVEHGNDMTLDEWLNDVDQRDILAGALASADPVSRRAASARLDDADERFLLVTVTCPCVWGDEVENTNGWRPEWQWWYFRRPALPGPILKEDLLANGLLDR
jgi:hypothetical protein